MSSPNKNCPTCRTKLDIGLQSWHFKCPNCNYEGSDLQPAINIESAHAFIDEKARENGLRTLRSKNFKFLIEKILQEKPEGSDLLEVGCAHGWFLELAQKHFNTVGIEPDEEVAQKTLIKGLPVLQGYFPADIPGNKKFDIIIFNDVIEHIPNIPYIIEQCHLHLNPEGLLVLNLPSSDGFFYKVSKLLSKLSILSPFERMWQKGLPSPHVHYFNRKNLTPLIHQHEFEITQQGTLRTISHDGLYDRISFASGMNKLSRMAIYIAISASIPFFRLLPSDIFYVIAKKQNPRT